MKMSEYLSKKRILLLVTIVLIITIIIVSIFTLLNKNKERNKVQEQDFSVTYILNKETFAPMDIETGLNTIPLSTINIKNNKNYTQEYKLIIKSKENSTLELSKVYININNETKVLSDYQDGVVYQGSLNSKSDITISFKTWIAGDLITPEDEDKVLNLKYDVIKK